MNLVNLYLLNKENKQQLKFSNFLKEVKENKECNYSKVNNFITNKTKFYFPEFKINIQKNFENNLEFIKCCDYYYNCVVYDLLIRNPKIKKEYKSKLDIYLILSVLHDVIVGTYESGKEHLYEHEYESSYLRNKKKFFNDIDTFLEFEKIIERKNVFYNQKSRFLILNIIFSYKEIYFNLNHKLKLICYKEFSKLNLISKKIIASILMKNKNDEAILNLINYGLNLQWDISIDKDKSNICFELFSSLDWVRSIYNNNLLNIKFTNKKGENLLFYLNGNMLYENDIEEIIRRKINSLNVQERNYLFFQLNNEGLTPLMKAVIFQDEVLIDFILSFNIKPWDKIQGAPLQESALDFLNNNILLTYEESSWGKLVDFLKDSFWYSLAKKWNSEFYYNKLKDDLSNNTLKENKKIKI